MPVWMAAKFKDVTPREDRVAAALRMAAAISSTSSTRVQGLFPYVNFADMYADQNETDEFARKLYGPNYPRLQKLKADYDPDRVFNRWFGIWPAL